MVVLNKPFTPLGHLSKVFSCGMNWFWCVLSDRFSLNISFLPVPHLKYNAYQMSSRLGTEQCNTCLEVQMVFPLGSSVYMTITQ